jgi:hypothetical protein
VSLTPTQELELQALSGAAQRRNQPRLLIFLAFVLILISAFYAFSGYSAVSSSRIKAQRQADTDSQLDAKIERYNNLTQGGAEGGLDERFPVNSRIRSTLESSADLFGLDTPTVAQRPERAGLDYPLLRQIITANISDAPLEPTLQWINSATRNIDGLYVAGVEFSPTGSGWQVEVRFARWEVVP